VSRDQIELLGTTLAIVQARLDGLRESPEWARIRRSVRGDETAILDAQNQRREEIPVQVPTSRTQAPRPLSAIVYRDSERQVCEFTEAIWTHYYQSLIDAIEQRPGGSRPLVSSSSTGTGSGNAPPGAISPTIAAPSPVGAGTQEADSLAGTWRYPEGSQQFNGVEEPRSVLLELWSEKGMLVGRLRGAVFGFDGIHNMDLHLQQVAGPKGTHEVRFRSQGPDESATGQIVVEAASPGGNEVMMIHTDGNFIPKGRETLLRR
jgi:hypothetical protein